MESDFVSALIYFKDNEKEKENVIIKLNDEVDFRNDDEIFFYCKGGIDEVKSLMEENNGEDFVIIDWCYI